MHALLTESEAAVRAELAQDEDVVAAWIFGSVARGEVTPQSDIDVALLTKTTPRSLAEMPTETEDRLTRDLGRHVQITLLRDAPADLIHRVLRDGHLVLDRSPRVRVAFEVASRNRYFDMQPIWNRYRGLDPRPGDHGGPDDRR